MFAKWQRIAPYVVPGGIAVGLLVLLFWQLSLQRPVIDIGDGGFLSGEPCGPPCFWGIVPGQTTEAEAIAILQARGVFTHCEVYVRETEGCVRGIRCPPRPRSLFDVHLNCNGDFVEGISFTPSFKITVQDAVAKYGKPDGILVFLDGIPEEPYLVLQITYSGIQTYLTLPRQKWPGYLLEASTPIVDIAYVPPF